MSRINILPKTIYNRISAGEVVDRPYSVVKELIENSIDAGSKNISIYIEKGGKQLIKIEDDGCGIEKEDLHNAFLPHATSKLCCVEDLYKISTLGFRGEALASISSVAGVRICSKTLNSDFCYEISCNGGEIGQVKECQGFDGTIIEVRNLFYNTPAREKFMKTDKGEESDISNIISKFILSNPEISFSYYIEDKLSMQSYGGGTEEALLAVYGNQTLHDCYCISTIKNGIEISGYISKPHFTKSNRTYQSVFLNGRCITNATISSAVQNAYSSYLMKRQYPFYVLYVNVPTEIVDVNVTPNKSDVRFANNQIIYGSIYSVISSVLDGRATALEIITDTPEEVKESVKEELNQVAQETRDFLNSIQNTTKKEEKSIKYESIEKVLPDRITFNDSVVDSYTTQSVIPQIQGQDIYEENKKYLDSLNKPVQEKIDFSFYQYKGNLFNTYLIYEYGREVFLIDQHAAHERLIYDKLKKSIASHNVILQPMLVPYIWNLNMQEFAFIQEKIDYIREIGFEIEEFGTNTYKISAVPLDLQDIDLSDFLGELVSDTSSLRGIKLEELIKDRIAMQACKSAVKGGMALSQNEIDSLFESLSLNFGLKCPHGRPIAIKIEKTQIEKLFKRIV